MRTSKGFTSPARNDLKTMGKPIRLNLLIRQDTDPELYRYLSALPPRRRCDRFRLLAERGLTMETTGARHLDPAGQVPIHESSGAETGGLGNDLAELY